MLISIIALLLVGTYLYVSLEKYFVTLTAHTLEARARLIAFQLDNVDFTLENREFFQSVVDRSSSLTNTRVSIIDNEGRSLGESAAHQDLMSRPEILQALNNKIGIDLRLGRCTHKVLYVAIPVVRDNEIVGIISVAKNLGFFSKKRNLLSLQFFMFTAIILAILILLSYCFSRQYSKPIQYINEKAHKFARGDFSVRMDTSRSAELSVVAESFNYMAETIQKRMDIIVSQSNNLNAILNSMTNAVIAVDSEERIIDVNPAALSWLKLTREEIEGHNMHEVIHHKALQTFIRESMRLNVPQDADITVYLDNEHVLNVKSSPIYDINNTVDGCVIVFFDVTKIRQLNMMRREFVSNVSHEIRTPLTVIKGSAEILQQEMPNDPESARFLNIINKHTERLTSLINDLLLLSRIEQDSNELDKEPTLLTTVINTAVNALEPKIEEKHIQITIDCPDDLTVNVNSGLISQALINLIENAMKYSDEASRVEITAYVVGCFVRISVRDHGPGIDRKHFERLFERFYRVDEARSRKIGGTGLGLAIVKHIVRAYNGNVDVESDVGIGSTFTIILPLK